MKLGIMQPYFFPYLGYFDLIHFTDRWIIFDTPQYIRHGWVNRNRILHPKTSWQYILVPIKKHAREQAIHEIQTVDDCWKQRILGQLNHYRKRAPYFQQTMELVRDCFDIRDNRLARINARCLSKACQFLGIDFQEELFSDMDVELGSINGPGDWAFEISRALGADTYVNPIGGESIFDAEKFNRGGIDLQLRRFQPMEYDCGSYTFEPSLSILDVLMWNRPKEILDFLQSGPSNNPNEVVHTKCRLTRTTTDV